MEEQLLHRTWQKAGNASLELDADDGFTYKIRYAGRYAPSVGADFKDALLERSDGKSIMGDVEIHVTEDDWKQHKHHLDPKYNSVILHVVFEFGNTRAQTADKRQPPCVLLNLNRLSELKSGGITKPQASFLHSDISAAGDERFINRASGYRLEILANGADQAIYAGILECLGYSNNKTGFIRLAKRLPWRTIVQLNNSQIETTMLFAAGFAKWSPNSPKLNGRAPNWNSTFGRPYNHPKNRISGIAALISAIKRAGGPAQYCKKTLYNTRYNYDSLLERFSSTNHPQKYCRIGKQRASEIVINAVLPATFALGELRNDRYLTKSAIQTYREFPALQTNSKLTEALRVFEIHKDAFSTLKAREQQGLLHLYRMFTLNLTKAS